MMIEKCSLAAVGKPIFFPNVLLGFDFFLYNNLRDNVFLSPYILSMLTVQDGTLTELVRKHYESFDSKLGVSIEVTKTHFIFLLLFFKCFLNHFYIIVRYVEHISKTWTSILYPTWCQNRVESIYLNF